MKKYVLLILITTTLFSSCELVVDVDVPLESPKLTLNCFFTPDSVWHAELYLNRHILDNTSFMGIADGKIDVYKDGQYVETLVQKGVGVFRSTLSKPVYGQEYELRAESTKYGAVTGKSTAPEPVKIIEATVVIPSSGGPFPGSISSDDESTITIKFQDKKNEVNYYAVRAFMEKTYNVQIPGGPPAKRVVLQQLYLEPVDSGFGDDTESNLFDDVLFDGKEVTMQFKTYLWSLTPNDKIFIYFSSASGDYYRYKRTLSLQQDASGDPFAQPVNVYNNIENGFGIVAGYSEDVAVYPK